MNVQEIELVVVGRSVERGNDANASSGVVARVN
jgi:hypothetical protein